MARSTAGGSAAVIRGRRLSWYVAVLCFGFGVLYLSTRSVILPGDAAHFVESARLGDPAELHFAEPSHFLQVPLVRAGWRMLGALGIPVSLAALFVGLTLAGTLASIVCVGLIAAEVLQSESGAWLAAILYGTSLHALTQWNGELYGLALGFVTAGLLLTFRGLVGVPAMLWALSVLSHSEFALAAPAFIAAIWMAHPDGVPNGVKLRRASALIALAAATTVMVMLLGSLSLGKWSDTASLVAWLDRSYQSRQRDVSAYPEVFRAIKGLATAYTVAGHYWRDILTGRGQYHAAWFVPAAAVGLLVLLLTAVFVIVARWRPRVWFALLWLLPFHVVVNWWFVPTVEKYHAGALPGFVLLVTGGILAAGTRLRPGPRRLFYTAYVAACAGLNLFGAVLPMQARARDTRRAEIEIRRFADERGGRAVFIACDDPKAIVGARVDFLRLRSVWLGTSVEIQQALVSWTRARLSEGKEPYLVGRWCLPEEWKTTSTKAPFDLFFLERSFRLAPTGLEDMPISESVPTNPFNWTRGAVRRLEPD